MTSIKLDYKKLPERLSPDDIKAILQRCKALETALTKSQASRMRLIKKLAALQNDYTDLRNQFLNLQATKP